MSRYAASRVSSLPACQMYVSPGYAAGEIEHFEKIIEVCRVVKLLCLLAPYRPNKLCTR